MAKKKPSKKRFCAIAVFPTTYAFFVVFFLPCFTYWPFGGIFHLFEISMTMNRVEMKERWEKVQNCVLPSWNTIRVFWSVSNAPVFALYNMVLQRNPCVVERTQCKIVNQKVTWIINTDTEIICASCWQKCYCLCVLCVCMWRKDKSERKIEKHSEQKEDI